MKKKTFLTMDGNEACAYGSYAFSEVAGIYPITPSSPMAEHIDAWAAKGKKNIFGSEVKVSEMQSEAGASGTVHGALQGGALASTYTASQGLLLMIPNIYKWVGEELPAVMHVSARSLAMHALSIFGDHQDIYAVRQTGITMICSNSVQEVADLAPLAHLVAIDASAPVLHFFDGFRTSHEIQKVELQDYQDLAKLLNKKALAKFKARALNPHCNSVTRGSNQNDDVYFQAREAQNLHYGKVVDVVEKYMNDISKLTGRHYAPFVYYGDKKAERVIVAMGSVCETIEETIDELAKKDQKLGLIKVHLYRPFSKEKILEVLPKSVKKIAVLDRTKEMGSSGEPLYLDVYNAIKEARKDIVIVGGRYGLSSKDVQPSQIKAVYDNLKVKKPLNNFSVGIVDDVTNLSLKEDKKFHTTNDYTSCLFYGLGSDGTVSANKNSIKIIGDHTNLYSQAYFAYDSKKAGGATRSNLRFGKTPIRSTYYVKNADFISCSLDSYLFKYDMISNLKVGGTFLLNTSFNKDEIIEKLPYLVKKQLAEKKAKFFIIDANKIAHEIGMGRKTNTILQSAFFKLNPTILKYEKAIEYMKAAVLKSYSKKGQEIVELNYKAIELGGSAIQEIKVDKSWAKLEVINKRKSDDEYFVFTEQMSSLNGNDIPTSAFVNLGIEDGTMHNNITYEEKRNIADEVPKWNSKKCIQCGKCVFVCPHATIRAFLLNEEEVKKAPKVVKEDLIDAMGNNVKGLKYKIQVSPDNCVGCGLCAQECPTKALDMVSVKGQMAESKGADYLYKKVKYKNNYFPLNTLKGVSLLRPYFEVSGSCAGCGETPYYRLLSQLFGKDLMIGNATGCSSIYCGAMPSTPFATDENNEGPAWDNSLFEDNAEFAYGMRVATDYKLTNIKRVMLENMEECEKPLQNLIKKYLEDQSNKAVAREVKKDLIKLVKESKCKGIKALLDMQDDIVDKSIWAIGGDGWAYDIGYGGLDHVIANEDNINILVLDTEVYSNTGGQASKSTQTGAIAKFAASGKKTAKKDLGAIAMSYQHVYVASIAMGANPVQTIKAFQEAESYNGPSIIIAYSPCIEHGIKGGLMNHQAEQRKAVECGYWPLYRYDPRLALEGKNPLQIDCKEPDFNKFKEFALSENRYSQLPIVNPANAEELIAKTRRCAEARWKRLKLMSEYDK